MRLLGMICSPWAPPRVGVRTTSWAQGADSNCVFSSQQSNHHHSNCLHHPQHAFNSGRRATGSRAHCLSWKCVTWRWCWPCCASPLCSASNQQATISSAFGNSTLGAASTPQSASAAYGPIRNSQGWGQGAFAIPAHAEALHSSVSQAWAARTPASLLPRWTGCCGSWSQTPVPASQ